MIETIPDRLIEHAPYSPDCNPIENLGNYFKKNFYKYIRAQSINTEFELMTMSRIAWAEKAENTQLVRSLIDSIVRRYQSVVENNGYHTKY